MDEFYVATVGNMVQNSASAGKFYLREASFTIRLACTLHWLVCGNNFINKGNMEKVKMFVMNNYDKLGNMKKKHSKIYIMLFTLLLCLICSGCTEKKNNDDKKIEENNEIVKIKTILNNSIVSEDELTPDAIVSNTILEKTEINLIEEYETYMVIKVTYPDAASLVIEALEDMEQEYDNEKVNSVYEKVAQRLKSEDVKMKEETLQVSFEIDDKENKQIVWSAELMNALSGGLYELMMDSQ